MIQGPPRADVEVSRTKIGRRPGCNTATVTFSFDQDVTAWSVRVNSTSHLDGEAVTGGQWIAVPLGFGTIPFGTGPFGGFIPVTGRGGEVEIDAGDLLHGANRVTVYGRGTDGRWTPPPVAALEAAP